MDVRCSFCHRTLRLHQTVSWRVLPCGHISCTDCDANALRFFNRSGFDTTALDVAAAHAFCPICSVPDEEDDEQEPAPTPDAQPFSPVLMQQRCQPQQQQTGVTTMPMLSALPTAQIQSPPLGCLDGLPCFVPQFQLHASPPYTPLCTTAAPPTAALPHTASLPIGLSLASTSTGDVPGSFGNGNNRDGGNARKGSMPRAQTKPQQRSSAKRSEFDRYLKQAAQVQANGNTAKRELQAQITGIFAQITQLMAEREVTINKAIEEKFDEFADKLGDQQRVLARLASQGAETAQGSGAHSPRDSAEARKTIEELSTTVTEAKSMLRKVKNLDFSSEIHSMQELISSDGEKDGLFSSFTEYLRTNNGNAQFEAVTDATLSKPMIRSWSDSVSQSAVLIAWTTPRDLEFAHRAEGFWYELEQRMAGEPDAAWHNVYKGVERTYVGKNMKSGTTYLFRCRVCVARHRFSLWSPEVAITPGTGLPDGKQNMVAPEISKALEQEVARSFVSGAASGIGGSAPAVVTTVVAPVASSSFQPAHLEQQQQPQPQFAPSSPRVQGQPLAGSKKPFVLPDSWCSFVPGPSCDISKANKVATALKPGAVAAGHILPKNSTTTVTLQLLRGTSMLVGVAPVFPSQSHPGLVLHSGWYVPIEAPPSVLPSGERPDHGPACHMNTRTNQQQQRALLREGETFSLTYNTRTNTLRVLTPHGTYFPGDVPGVAAPLSRTALVPVVVFSTPGDAVCLLSATQAP